MHHNKCLACRTMCRFAPVVARRVFEPEASTVLYTFITLIQCTSRFVSCDAKRLIISIIRLDCDNIKAQLLSGVVGNSSYFLKCFMSDDLLFCIYI